MKKEEVSKKMHREECDKCGSMKHHTKEHKGFSDKESRSAAKPTIESDYHRYSTTEDKFSKKDFKQEKKERKDKMSLGGKSESKAWEI